MKHSKLSTLVTLLLFLVTFNACNDDEELKPITLKDNEDITTINLKFPDIEGNGYSFPLQGGDGYYSVLSDNKDVVTAEMISSIDLKLNIIGLGKTTVTITDNSNNILVLTVTVNYEIHRYKIKEQSVEIKGDDLTQNEIKAIKEKQLANIPVKVGGGYEFIFTDLANNKGQVIIYSETFGIEGKEYPFELKKIKSPIIPESSNWGYEVTINDEKRTFIRGRYYNTSTRLEIIVPLALLEDVTDKVKEEYPKVEATCTFQAI